MTDARGDEAWPNAVAGNEARSLFEALRQHARNARRKRLPLDAVWEAFRGTIRGTTGEATARAALARLLGELANARLLCVPRGKQAWDHAATPALPRWVQLAASSEAQGPAIDAKTVAWPPELSFASTLGRSALLEELLAIKRFWADGGRTRPPIPLRERSLELFGDEKRLDALRRSQLFAEGRLSLSLLRCYEVPPPLVWEAPAERAWGEGEVRKARDASTALVIENLHTYDSFRRINAATPQYGAVIYGYGQQFVATARGLVQLAEVHGLTRVMYFGDLDRRGLRIAKGAAETLAETGGALTLEPATAWYALLLRRGTELGLDCADSSNGPLDEEDLAWLPPPLRRPVRALLGAGRRLPQEAVSLDVLKAPGLWHASVRGSS